MTIGHGFHATITAQPGKGDALEVRLSIAARQARTAWLDRLLNTL